MTNKIIEIATKIAAPPTQLILLKKNHQGQSKLIALWQLDEHSKLCCHWVQDITK